VVNNNNLPRLCIVCAAWSFNWRKRRIWEHVDTQQRHWQQQPHWRSAGVCLSVCVSVCLFVCLCVSLCLSAVMQSTPCVTHLQYILYHTHIHESIFLQMLYFSVSYNFIMQPSLGGCIQHCTLSVHRPFTSPSVPYLLLFLLLLLMTFIGCKLYHAANAPSQPLHNNSYPRTGTFSVVSWTLAMTMIAVNRNTLETLNSVEITTYTSNWRRSQVLQQSIFWQCAAKKCCHHFFEIFFLFFMCQYAINWCDKLRFCIYIYIQWR